MHLLRQILRLKHQGKSIRDIARSMAIARTTVFHRLEELNVAILDRVDAHNQLLFSGKAYSRRTHFQALSKVSSCSYPPQFTR